MTIFTPIAIVGQSCILPGALCVQTLWERVLAAEDLLSSCPEGRWRANPAAVMGRADWNNRAGYVRGFDQIFDAEGFKMPAAEILALDPLVHWVLHTGREALGQTTRPASARVGAVLGNLSLPSEGLAHFAESVWLDTQRPNPLDRFMSGLPAHLLARALDLDAGAFALDAACASSLYAIKLAIDRLHDHTADIMLAGAVNRADQLFLHIGFGALQALSPTGQSRPFHRNADGLVPSEGAACIALKRLDDAEQAGDHILGVIRAVGLSNDGRSQGLLVPSSKGQVRAVEAAYQMSGIDPGTVSLIECHATGTALGDGKELESLERVFGQTAGVPIGSLKSNIGHTITVAGLAGLLKVLGAMEAGTRPPTLHVEEPLEALQNSPLRLLTAAEPWDVAHRIAAVSAFGFGGNNSHLIVEQWTPRSKPLTRAPAVASPTDDTIAIVGIGVVAGPCHGREAFVHALRTQTLPADRSFEAHIPLKGLRFPPKDLEASLGQQLLILEAAHEALAGHDLPRKRTSVLIGMGCDPDIVRHGLAARQQDGTHQLSAAQVIGSLPNIVANRLNAQFDLAGPSYVISAEQLSGIVALEQAVRALQMGEIDAALVGAVDLSTSDAHQAAARAVLPSEHHQPGDAAVVLVLKRTKDARLSGDTIFALLQHQSDAPPTAAQDFTTIFGHAHAASGLLRFTAAALHPQSPVPGTLRLTIEALGCATRSIDLQPNPQPFVAPNTARIYLEDDGLNRTVIVAATADELAQKRQRAAQFIAERKAPGEGVYFGHGSLDGEVASLFTGAAAAYHNMGRTLVDAFPELLEAVARRFAYLPEATRWTYSPEPAERPTPLEKLFGSSVLCQAHAEFTHGVLGLQPHAAIGFSSGETNALFAMGAWPRMDALYTEFCASNAFTEALGGHFDVLKRAWKEHDITQPRWESWRTVVPLAELLEALESEPLVHLTLIHAPGDYAIGGESQAIARIITRLGPDRTRHLDYDIAVHCPELGHYAKTWRTLHTRPTRSVPNIRFYSHATGTHYTPTPQSTADALLAQALHTVDFPRLIENAYSDGIRIFIEHGPQTTLTHWIHRILGDRPHTAVSLDSSTDSTLRPLANAIAQLIAAGVPLDWQAYNDRIAPHTSAPDPAILTFATHTTPPEIRNQVQIMEPAPWLPPI
ncbi:MAG: beta-ketoacyl synthase, partial [Bradymonadaceae bacterium]|nr:beta-ketoacyl synthase [Lujinxingiaceae bacterium]